MFSDPVLQLQDENKRLQEDLKRLKKLLEEARERNKEVCTSMLIKVNTRDLHNYFLRNVCLVKILFIFHQLLSKNIVNLDDISCKM